MNLVLQQQDTWQATLDLKLERVRGGTKLVHQKHVGPLRVQRHFPQPDGSCHIYLLHPPGGLVGGDTLAINVDAAESTHTLITSPSAGKFYRCSESAPHQKVTQTIDVGEQAHLEWLPQETIYFNGARAQVFNQVKLRRNSSYLGWDIQSLGRRASGEDFSKGELDQTSMIWRDGCLCHRERLVLSDKLTGSPWGINNASVLGTLLAIPREGRGEDAEAETANLRLILSAPGWGVTMRGCTIIVRYMGDSAETCRRGFERVRAHLVGKALFNGSTFGYEPRIWKT